ncbi:ABC transporter ATP-binding protein [Acuticoccus yangtzensis]|uniref:ABC transporter ATP-binding protein n=1 Tax=Acuticoccus yangtzensis TaxID=1443441 RepID=UPI000949A825|nr:ABC transporter ATP-binding protein [Acuticoccus yangtzensis]ORE92660.1 oligopeptide/dipeptide ABC transporter ATP-binding protein-like protein [Stappia sp. 22II-S9-Z10]
MTALLSVQNLTLHRGSRRILDDVSFDVPKGGTLALVGESGAGKSTIAVALMGLLTRAEASVEGKAILEDTGDLFTLRPRAWTRIRGRRLAMIFQDAGAALDPCYTVGGQIVSTLRRNLGLSRKAARARAVELLESVGIPDAAARLGAYPHELSGGMQQRVMIAIALSGNPALLFADEPTSALDVTIQAQIMRLILDEVRAHGSSCIFVLHDLALASQSCDEVVVLYAGQVMEAGDAKTLLSDPRHPYTALLKSCVLEIGTAELTPPEGSVPSYDAMPAGCRFATRCPNALPRCAGEKPPLVPRDGRNVACWNPVGVPKAEAA